MQLRLVLAAGRVNRLTFNQYHSLHEKCNLHIKHTSFTNFDRNFSRRRPLSSMNTGGRIVPPLPPSQPYDVGQYFLHERLGYRGVITGVWHADVFVYDCSDIDAMVLPRHDAHMLSILGSSGSDIPTAGATRALPRSGAQKSPLFTDGGIDVLIGSSSSSTKSERPMSPSDEKTNSTFSSNHLSDATCSKSDHQDSDEERAQLFGIVRESWGITDVNMRVLPAVSEDVIWFSTPIVRRRQYWYQVMVDRQDFAYDTRTNIACRNPTPATPALEYVDYVVHHDIMPYIPENAFFDNNFVNLLFTSDITDSERGVVGRRPILDRWLATTTRELSSKSVYQLTYKGFTIKAIPFYAAKGLHSHNWFYKIIIESEWKEAMNLIQRTWITRDSEGNIEIITGRGVVGFEPSFDQDSTFFSYSSKTYLETSTGRMGGFFTFLDQAEEGKLLHVPVPTFDLIAPPSQRLGALQAIKR